MKSTICHEFSSPDLLERPKDGKINENAVSFILKCSNKVHYISTLKYWSRSTHYDQWISSHSCWKCAKKIMDNAEKRTKSCAK